MKLNDFMSITELSRLTGKTRPTLYKYVRDYDGGKYDEIPYSFLVLLQLAEEPDVSRADLIEYCDKHYTRKTETSLALRELIEFITANENRLDLVRVRKIIETEIDKGKGQRKESSRFSRKYSI